MHGAWVWNLHGFRDDDDLMFKSERVCVVKETKHRRMLNGDNELMCDVQKWRNFFNLNESVLILCERER